MTRENDVPGRARNACPAKRDERPLAIAVERHALDGAEGRRSEDPDEAKLLGRQRVPAQDARPCPQKALATQPLPRDADPALREEDAGGPGVEPPRPVAGDRAHGVR